MKNTVYKGKDGGKEIKVDGGCRCLGLGGLDQSDDSGVERSTWAQDTAAGP